MQESAEASHEADRVECKRTEFAEREGEVDEVTDFGPGGEGWGRGR